MNKIRKLVAVDLVPSELCAKRKGFAFFPLREFLEWCRGDNVDVIEALVTLQRRVPDNDSPAALAQTAQQFENKRYALEMSGARIIESPSKRSHNSPSGFKQSDDQRLMIKTLTLAMKLRPDFLVLVAADGDYAPMIEALRDEGIRTEVAASAEMLAGDLRRHAVRVLDLEAILEELKQRRLEAPPAA